MVQRYCCAVKLPSAPPLQRKASVALASAGLSFVAAARCCCAVLCALGSANEEESYRSAESRMGIGIVDDDCSRMNKERSLFGWSCCC